MYRTWRWCTRVILVKLERCKMYADQWLGCAYQYFKIFGKLSLGQKNANWSVWRLNIFIVTNREDKNNRKRVSPCRYFDGYIIKNIVAAFRGMHVSPAKHSYGSVTDGRTDRQTDRQTDRRRTKWSLCVAMLRRRHKNIRKILMLSKRYESTEVDRRTWLHVHSGTLWSTSNETHQVVEI